MGHLSWRLAGLGLDGAVPYAVPPFTDSGTLQQTGKYQQKLDRAYDFHLNDEELYKLDAGMRNHLSGERELGVVYIQPIHECLARELDERPEVVAEWESVVSQPWIPSFENHPAVKGASLDERNRTFGVVIYMDASRFQTRDGLLVMTCHLVCSGNRHLVFALPKSSLCDCGCSGWCTLFRIYLGIYWSLEASIKGEKPSARHDGLDLDETRLAVAGKKLKWKFILLMWLEIGLNLFHGGVFLAGRPR